MIRYAFILLAAGVGVVSFTSAFADDIQLKNGQRYAGAVSRDGDLMVIRTEDGKTITTRPEDIASVTLNDSPSPAEAAAAEWTRITLQIQTADDLPTIITLHQKFLQQYPDAPRSKEVQSSLRVYQALAANDGVKFRGRWIPRAQIDVLLRQWKESATPATTLYGQRQFKDALAAAKAALAADDRNPDALTVAGLSAFHLKDAPAAKTYFTALLTANPTTLLAQNNLAVIASLQKQPAAALLHYAKALSVNPENRLLLDNIQEAIAAYLAGGGSRNAAPYRQLIAPLAAAEKKMEARMARPENGGLVRWGAGWITRDQRKTFDAYTDQAALESRQLDAQSRKANQALAAIEDQMNQANADVEEATRALNFVDAQLALTPPGQKVDSNILASQRDNAYQNLISAQVYKAAVQTEHDARVAATRDFFALADKFKQALAASMSRAATGYTGKQQLMEIGDDANPPAPAPVADPPALPALPALTLTVSNAAPVQRPTYQQILIPASPPRAR